MENGLLVLGMFEREFEVFGDGLPGHHGWGRRASCKLIPVTFHPDAGLKLLVRPWEIDRSSGRAVSMTSRHLVHDGGSREQIAIARLGRSVGVGTIEGDCYTD